MEIFKATHDIEWHFCLSFWSQLKHRDSLGKVFGIINQQPLIFIHTQAIIWKSIKSKLQTQKQTLKQSTFALALFIFDIDDIVVLSFHKLAPSDWRLI